MFVWTNAWWCILGSMVMEVEPLDIEAAVVASRKCGQLYVALEKEALSNRGSLHLEGQTQAAFVCRVDASDHQNLWSTPVVLDLPG